MYLFYLLEPIREFLGRRTTNEQVCRGLPLVCRIFDLITGACGVSSVLHMSVFSFRTGSTTFFAVLIYLPIFTFLYTTQYGPSVPPLQRQLALGPNLGQAYQDLHRVSFLGHAIYYIHRFSPPLDRLRSVRIPTILVKTTSYAISCWNG